MAKRKNTDDFNSIFFLIVATFVSILFWILPLTGFLLYPFRLFVTFIHEGGHALAAILTNGTVDQILVYANASGETYSRGGQTLVIASAGYLTSCAYGALLLAISRQGRFSERMLILNSVVIALIAVVLSDDTFTMMIGIGLCVGLIIAAHSRPFLSHFLLNFLAVQCCINAILDLLTLIRVSGSASVHSDALILEKLTRVPSLLWAFTWAVISGLFLLGGLLIYSRGGTVRK